MKLIKNLRQTANCPNKRNKCSRTESNCRPLAHKTNALTTELHELIYFNIFVNIKKH